ncbi:hypothetical protein OH809_32250 [Streptomyces sp. NBC_00873]|uniref:hypothetical protein n=1 Tax=unclassified Streptomyces TaxID=2593676 RepID=UPI003864881E|nr:hypothetical protein OH809_32250 [Streptomyces sp. NBC_00873]WTA43151.1 hypothetical protein OH821_11470 [Streptomyces sp. NBC_00842]
MTSAPPDPRTRDGLDRTDRAALKHVHGSAVEVPGWVRDVYAPERAEEAVDEVLASVYHQGGQICSAAPPLRRGPGTSTGAEPTETGSGPDGMYCRCTASDITYD